MCHTWLARMPSGLTTMRVTILVDAGFGGRERAMLARLQVGLADEGVRVVYATPTGLGEDAVGVIAARVVYEDRGMPWTLEARAQRLAEAVERAATSRTEGPRGVLHVFGEGAWGLAARVVRRTGDCLVVECWSGSLRRRLSRPPWMGLAPSNVLIACPEPSLERIAERSGSEARVIPWGVPVPSQAREILPEDRAPAMLMVGSGRDRGAMAAVVEAFSSVAAPDAILCVDAECARVAKLWPIIKKCGLTGRTTLIPDVEGRRELALLGCDVVLAPEALGECRSILLEAMAAGLPVIAAADGALDSIAGGQTARLIAGADPKLWTSAMAEFLREPDSARALGAAAREHVRQHHRVSAQVSLTLNAYEHLAGARTVGA